MKKVKLFGREFVIFSKDEVTELCNELGDVNWEMFTAKVYLDDAIKTKNGERKRTDLDSASDHTTSAAYRIHKLVRRLLKIVES